MKKFCSFLFILICSAVCLWAEKPCINGEFHSNPGLGFSKYYIVIDDTTFKWQEAHGNSYLIFNYTYDSKNIYISMENILGENIKSIKDDMTEELYDTLALRKPIPYKYEDGYLYLQLKDGWKKYQEAESKKTYLKKAGEIAGGIAAGVTAIAGTAAAVSAVKENAVDNAEPVATRDELDDLTDKIRNAAW